VLCLRKANVGPANVPDFAGIPFLAEAADGFAQAHSERGDSFETLLRALWELSVALATDFGEEKFRVSEDAGERIVEFVAENFAEVFFVERAWRVRSFLRFGGLGIGYRWPRQIGFLQTSSTRSRASSDNRQSGQRNPPVRRPRARPFLPGVVHHQ